MPDKKTPPSGRGYVTVMKERILSVVSEEQGLTVNFRAGQFGFSALHMILGIKNGLLPGKKKKEKVD
ncbi:MAG: hypothetical protein WDO16_21790 [Bacteroidota bacterium]